MRQAATEGLRGRHTGRRVPADLDNATVAAELQAFAALLDLAESTPYASRATGAAAATIRETRAPIMVLVREGRVRELRGIGPGISARLQGARRDHLDRRAGRAPAESDRSSSGSAACSGSRRSGCWRSPPPSAPRRPRTSAGSPARARCSACRASRTSDRAPILDFRDRPACGAHAARRPRSRRRDRRGARW